MSFFGDPRRGAAGGAQPLLVLLPLALLLLVSLMVVSLLLVSLLIATLLAAGAAGAGAPVLEAVAAPPEPPWTPVHPERLQRLTGVPIGEVCFDGTPPKKLAGNAPELPPGSAYLRFGGVLIAHCLVDDEGYVVEAQLWKTPDPADRQAVARALAGWRFAPARRRDGHPAAVHFTVAIPIARDR
ncbi:MAG TPA: hypothetical protein VHG32_00335 [Thermoanaerobaculia bacterium]|jgi:hypothetical protein|nr:hypothetical protein [Thermoanaerobaculia bacterium]